MLSPALSRLLLLVERFGFPAIFFVLAYKQVAALQLGFLAQQHGGAAAFSQIVWEGLLLAFYVVNGILILISRVPVRPPQNLKEVLLPIVATFVSVSWSFDSLLPDLLRQPLVDGEVRATISAIALPVSVLAYLFSFWAILHLGRSMAIYVAVRKVVRTGPYRWVRHPMYTGYTLELTGLALAAATPSAALRAALIVVLLVWRARLEEQALAAASSDYRQHLGRTGFLFPRLHRPRSNKL